MSAPEKKKVRTTELSHHFRGMPGERESDEERRGGLYRIRLDCDDGGGAQSTASQQADTRYSSIWPSFEGGKRNGACVLVFQPSLMFAGSVDMSLTGLEPSKEWEVLALPQ